MHVQEQAFAVRLRQVGGRRDEDLNARNLALLDSDRESLTMAAMSAATAAELWRASSFQAAAFAGMTFQPSG
jgi:hypothetical protein